MSFIYRLDKFGPVILRIRRDGAERIGNQGHDHIGVDAVLSGAERPNRNFTVLGTGILRNALAVVGAVDVHFAAAVGAIHQSG